MNERQDYQATDEARRAVLHDAGHEHPSSDHMEALLRYLKGAGDVRSGHPESVKPLDDTGIRARALDLVQRAGGEATVVMVAAGAVWVRGHVRRHSEVAPLRRSLAAIPGVTRADIQLSYDVDDGEGDGDGASGAAGDSAAH